MHPALLDQQSCCHTNATSYALLRDNQTVHDSCLRVECQCTAVGASPSCHPHQMLLPPSLQTCPTGGEPWIWGVQWPVLMALLQNQARKKSTKINSLGPETIQGVGWGCSTRRGGGRKVRALPRKFVFLGFRREESGMSREFFWDVPDPRRCSKKFVQKQFMPMFRTSAKIWKYTSDLYCIVLQKYASLWLEFLSGCV